MGTVDVTVVRKGNLNQYAIVLCRTEHGSATASSSTSTGLADYVEHAGQVGFAMANFFQFLLFGIMFVAGLCWGRFLKKIVDCFMRFWFHINFLR